MDKSNILIIDNNKFYWDSANECLIPYELIENNNLNSNHNQNITSNLNNNNNINNNGLNKNINKDNNNNIDNDNDNDNIKNEWYMENFDIDFWENILSRQLDKDEKKIFHGILNENSLNLDIKMLQKSIIKNHCYIKSITNNVGNCLFESLGSLDLGDNDLGIQPSEMIRKNLASILLSVKTEIGFFPNIPNSTPEEIFLNYNDVEFVKDSKTNTIYVYDYDMMIFDLNSNYSWARLPTEFLLMAISRIYQFEILIYHNKTDYVNKITVWNNQISNNDIEKIRLGQINEEHYFPLLELPNELKYDKDVLDEIINTDVKYDNYIKKFKKWSKVMMDSMNSINIPNEQNISKSTHIDINSNYKNLCDNLSNNLSEELYENLANSSIDVTNDTDLNELKIMKTKNKLTQEQIDDYNQISNFDEFAFI